MNELNGIFSKEAFDVFFQTVQVMWQGMLGIFFVMSIIAIIVFLFSKFSKPDKKED